MKHRRLGMKGKEPPDTDSRTHTSTRGDAFSCSVVMHIHIRVIFLRLCAGRRELARPPTHHWCVTGRVSGLPHRRSTLRVRLIGATLKTPSCVYQCLNDTWDTHSHTQRGTILFAIPDKQATWNISNKRSYRAGGLIDNTSSALPLTPPRPNRARVSPSPHCARAAHAASRPHAPHLAMAPPAQQPLEHFAETGRKVIGAGLNYK